MASRVIAAVVVFWWVVVGLDVALAKIVSDLPGHPSITTTLDLYSPTSPTTQSEAAAKMSDLALVPKRGLTAA